MLLTGGVANEPSPRLRVEPTSSTPPTRPASSGPTGAERREFDRRILRAAVIVTLVIVVAVVTVLLVWRLRALVLLMIVSLFGAAVLHPIVLWVQHLGLRRKKPRPLSRGLAATAVFLLAFVLLIAVIAAIATPAIDEAARFIKALPHLVTQAQQGKGQVGRLVARFHLLKFVQSRQTSLQNIISKLSKPAFAIGKTVVSGLASLLTVIFLSFFLLLEGPPLVRGVLDWMQPERSERVRAVLGEVIQANVGYVLGNLLTSIIAGVVVGVALYVMGVPYVEVLALWVALVDFLPLIGGLLAGVPTVVIASLHSLTAGIVLLIVFLAYQEIENHFLNPVVMSRTVRLNPLWVLLAVLIGAELGDLVGSVFGGFIGALIAVPTAGALHVVARDLWRHRTGATRPDLTSTRAGIVTAPVPPSPPAAPVEHLPSPD